MAGSLRGGGGLKASPSEPSIPIQEAASAQRLSAEGGTKAEGVLRQRNLIFQT